MKHTKGPWKVGSRRKYHRQVYRTIVAPNSHLPESIPICWITNDETDNEPNAHLIASAPDLLEVLIKLADFPLVNITKDGYAETFCSMRRIARQAIAKAEGKG